MEPIPPNDRQYPVESFSLAERDRRWGLVRSLMGSAGVDILVAPTESDSRYLTQMAYDIGPAIVPMVGEVTALTDKGRVGSAAHEWVSDIRPGNRRWAEGIVERLQELDADGKILGVVGLDGLVSRPDGDFNYSTFIGMREAFPHARWIGATALMEEARYRKSPEEIAFLTRAARGADVGLLAAATCMRAGVSDRELWGQMVLAVMRAGADHPRHAHLGVTPLDDVRGLPVQPVDRLVARGDILSSEVGGRYSGYEARGAQPAAVGPVPQDWRDAWQAHEEAWERCWQMLRPGVRLDEVAARTRPGAAGPFLIHLTFRGQGLGDDVPLLMSGSRPPSRMADRPLEEGVCFSLAPLVEWADARGVKKLSWGDTVVITSDGARRLGTRPHEFIINE